MSNPPAESSFGNTTLSHIKKVLLNEEDKDDENWCEFHDTLALQAMENYFSQALHHQDSTILNTDEDEDLFLLFERLFSSQATPYGHKAPKAIIKSCSKDHNNIHNSNKKSRKRSKEATDFKSLLFNCAKAVHINNREVASSLITHIEELSSPFGDGLQRVSHYFAYALKARFDGIGPQLYASMSLEELSSLADKLETNKRIFSANPFGNVTFKFEFQHIMNLADKSKTLHIVDFGIGLGTRWAYVVKCLSQRPESVPKIRITGIEAPQPGLEPSEQVKRIGLLLRYCQCQNIAFEFHAILAKRWHTIQIEDLGIDPDNEAIVVTCMYRFEKLGNELIGTNLDTPKMAVLNLIRKINPNLFIPQIVNAKYDSSPIFLIRIRETFSHYAMLFDMLDATLSKKEEARLKHERALGLEILNLVACEGSERMDSAESYKKWQWQIARVGFRPRPIDENLINTLRSMVKENYNKDFFIEEDEQWILQGWKGRILYASSCWIPT